MVPRPTPSALAISATVMSRALYRITAGQRWVRWIFRDCY